MIKKILFFIALITIFVRFVGLGQVPSALNRDEVGIGYNAFSIIETGRDEHGQTFPLNFESIGDYKMPLYIYFTTLSVKVFGLNEFSVKFFSALAGSLSVVAVYFLSKKFFKSTTTATIAAGLLALNPWAVFYSRVGFEANLSLAFFLIGLNLLLNSKLAHQVLGVILFLLAGFTYSSSLIFIPPIVLVILLSERHSIVKNKNKTLPYLIYFIFFAFEFYLLWSTSSNKSTISIFSNPTLIDQFNTLRVTLSETQPLWAKIWLNRYFYLGRLFTTNYFKTFSLKFLLLEGGGHPWHRIPGLGYFYLIEIIFFIYGLLHLLIFKYRSLGTVPKDLYLIFTWLILSPVASAITIDAPHSTRSLHLLPVVIILAAYGLNHFFANTKPKFLKITVISIYLAHLIYATYQYTYTYRQTAYQDIPVGLSQILKEIKPQDYNQIYFFEPVDFAYLYPAFYYKYSPEDFQANAHWSGRDLVGLTHVTSFGNFNFINTLENLESSSLIITPASNNLNNQLNHRPLIFSNQHYSAYLVE